MSQLIPAIKRQLAIHNLPSRPAKSILLTFDDGPHPTRTPRILELLAHFNARAVFFVIGRQVPAHADIVRRTAEQGHIIGNHSQTHQRSPNPVRAYTEVEHCQREVERVTGQRPRLFRPPYGQLSSATVPYTVLTGLRRVLWSLDPKDFKLRDPELAVEAGHKLAAELNRPERHAEIVLLHDESPCTGILLETLLTQLEPCDLSSGAALLNG